MFKIPLFPRLFFTELFKWSDAISLPCGHDGQVKYQSSSRTMVEELWYFSCPSCPRDGKIASDHLKSS